jgi:phage terminase Nu1 subunit (DNA packaging protein)
MTKFMTQTEYADHRGISQPRISTMIKTGKIPASAMKKISGKKLIDMEKADVALAENLDRVHNPNPEPRKRKNKKQPTVPEMKQTAEKAGTGGMTLSKAQQVQAQYKAALLKLEYESKSGKLIDAEVVEVETFNFARRVRDAIQNVPDRICAELASCTDVHQVREKLNAAYNEALEELSK